MHGHHLGGPYVWWRMHTSCALLALACGTHACVCACVCVRVYVTRWAQGGIPALAHAYSPVQSNTVTVKNMKHVLTWGCALRSEAHSLHPASASLRQPQARQRSASNHACAGAAHAAHALISQTRCLSGHCPASFVRECFGPEVYYVWKCVLFTPLPSKAAALHLPPHCHRRH
jgi:hypothetical protein